jgi:glutathione S-transferase
VPVLIDGDLVLFDSWTIAPYLDDVYADRPSLFGGEGGRAATRFINGWSDSVLVAGIVRLVVNDIFAHLGRKRPRLFLREPQEAIWDEAGRHIRGSRCTRGRFS